VSNEVPGGGFLATPLDAPAPWAAPLDDEARALGEASRAFVRRAVLPANAKLEGGDRELLRALVGRAGAAGLLGAALPVEVGGLGAGPRAADAAMSGLGLHASFAVTCAAHLTIGGVPLLRHGTAEQRAAILPGIASGARVSAYALTEPGSGSDALRLATRARRDGDDFRLSGQKQFVTNAGIADQIVVVALVEGAGPTCFVVDARAAGLTTGAEERKLGLHGSSTRALFLDEVAVGTGDVIGGVGNGHRVALEALTVGRHKVGVLAGGHLELLVELGARYAADRRQFGRPIGAFQLVGDLLADTIAEAAALRAATARAAGLCAHDARDLLAALVEAGACKLAGAEALCRGADAMLQLHGGLGFLETSQVAQSYRDVRVNRIYEGTDEVNRRQIAGGLLRAARRGRLDVAALAAEARATLATTGAAPRALAAHTRALALVGLAAAIELAQAAPRDDAEGAGEATEWLEGPLAELALQAYLATSALPLAAGHETARAAVTLACARSVERAHAAYGAIAARAPDGAMPTRGLSLLDVAPRLDRAALRRAVADAALAAGGDPLIAAGIF
jgi:alkylation response protein AidB-like acyl-CoA dehydrogenase